MVRPPEVVVTEKPRSAGAFFLLQYSSMRSVLFYTFVARADCYPGRMSQERLALYSILFGVGLVVIAALVLVVFAF
jgi:hypothetical protein